MPNSEVASFVSSEMVECPLCRAKYVHFVTVVVALEAKIACDKSM